MRTDGYNNQTVLNTVIIAVEVIIIADTSLLEHHWTSHKATETLKKLDEQGDEIQDTRRFLKTVQADTNVLERQIIKHMKAFGTYPPVDFILKLNDRFGYTIQYHVMEDFVLQVYVKAFTKFNVMR